MTKRAFTRTARSMFLLSFLVLPSGLIHSQEPPSEDLRVLKIIPIPNWTTTGSTQANFDLLTFNPATRVMYLADRVNHGATAIDTRTNTVLGTVVPPNCASGSSCPSGALLVPDLQELVLTDRRTTVYIYDLRVPTPSPVTVTVPSGSDELDYDPLHHRVYVANTNAPFFLTAIDLVGPSANTVVAQIPLSSNPEQPRFNPVDGTIWENITDEDHGGAGSSVAVIDTTANAVVTTFPIPNCQPHGIDIDPASRRALLGCSGSNPQKLVSLADGSVLENFPQVSGTDVESFNPNLRRWYTASGNNRVSDVGCPKDTTGAFPVVGVFAARAERPEDEDKSADSDDDGSPARFVEAQCSARNGHGLGVDPIQNNIYVGARQFPADPNNPNTGQAGVLVFHDPARLAQGAFRRGRAFLEPLGGSGVAGRVAFLVRGRKLGVRAEIEGLPDDGPVLLNVTTTVGNEVVPCAVSDGSARCRGTLLGDPLIGGVVLAGAGGTAVARGTIRGDGAEKSE